ncbi:MAG: iron ABC transporter permease [Candidatus Eisenbacteria bacterium]|uniref:Iron ABC transporter permease n=1 Tax=Eiseniibacteriota bacterium TaxID=2212470 RepID=A0A948S166_UNCEI|nr:iron ABC transporter permease [Candidatus Eisenbacteria bacterium]MBU1949846.1 iron ABC transporter permease [Candidatus Eisenbacteria bacterium]MBU2693299.1 iron ABC transporter permease [Candidatus Eisenbacteria bacterium]
MSEAQSQDEKLNRRRFNAGFLTACALLLLLATLSLGVGSTSLGLDGALRVILWKVPLLRPLSNGTPSGPEISIIWDIRLPRIILAILVGGALSLAGALMQAYFRNALAGPFVVGVSSGAAFGAVAAIVFGLNISFAGISAVPLCAFVGGLAVVMLVGLLNNRTGAARVESLLLTGIAVGSVLSAAASLMMITSQESLQSILFWLLGSLSSARWLHVSWVLPFFLAGSIPAFLLARDLNALAWGDEIAHSLGVSVKRSRNIVLICATLLATSAVAVAGIIGFLGLMMPHVARFVVGSDHRRVLPLSFIFGAILLLTADLAARTLWAPTELPIGALTAIFGAPFLAYLCNRRR